MKQGPEVIIKHISQWFKSATEPEFESFLPKIEKEINFTISFEIMALLDLDYDPDNGWRFR